MSNPSNKWTKEIALLRHLTLQVGLLEVTKWGNICFMYDNKNIVMIQPFKEYCSLGFFKGAILKDKKQVLVKAGEYTQNARQMRFSHVEEIIKQKSIILSYLKEAVDIEKKGMKLRPDPKKMAIHIEELEDAFLLDPIFKRSFEALTQGRQRGYLLHFSAAKQSETIKNRINKYISQIKCGKGLHDCTCGLSKKMPICDGSHKNMNIKVG